MAANNQHFIGFNADCTGFLNELSGNNNRDWFSENKTRYEQRVLTPALNFISAMGPEIRAISPHFDAIPKRIGGSLMRIYRDTRFANDKTPYKTNIGIQFRHRLGKDVHAPGFYVHIEADQAFLGAGIWRPDAKALNKIREYIIDNPASWIKARDNKAFRKHFELSGECLKNPPRGYAKDHPLIEDLKRKDFIAIAELDIGDIRSAAFVKAAGKSFKTAAPYMELLCSALEVQF